MNITIPDEQVREIYGILLRARASEVYERERINRMAVAYHDRGWMQNNVINVHESRIETLTGLIDQVREQMDAR